MKHSPKEQEMNECAAKVQEHFKADILIYFGPIIRNWDDWVIDETAKNRKHPNILLMLTTNGGDAHPAYRIARCLQEKYRTKRSETDGNGELIIFINSVCASAGTLIALAADRLILSDHAELGPLDVQMRKPDEVGERTSGLTPIQALDYLETECSDFFQTQFISLRFSPNLSFSTRMAADIAAAMASGLLSKLYEQIDPLRLAEYDRSNRIAHEYGERIKSQNVKAGTIQRLLEGYPSHEFCIDSTEAKELFNKVEKPIPELEHFGLLLKPFAEKHLYNPQPAVLYWDVPKPKSDEKHEQTIDQQSHGDQGNGAADGEKPSRKRHAATTPSKTR